MSTSSSTNTTNNYQLTKPLASDTYDVEVFNNNMDKLDKINLPIGSVIWNKNQINPSDYYYGTWEAVEDVFILAASQNYPSGSTGGNFKITLTENNLPNISGTVSGVLTYASNGRGHFRASKENGSSSGTGTSNHWSTITYSFGGGQQTDITPPYKSYYCWERIS